ncbi:hypothetical protein PtB15_3B129 [Puccinia triticina]|nr:hypothetical protein PtB15_3B129 [Puccinia triticina]
MAQSATSTGLDAPNGPEAQSSANEQYWPQGDQAIDALVSLAERLTSHIYNDANEEVFPASAEECSSEQVKTKKDLWSDLHSNLLPQLGRHIGILSSLLEPEWMHFTLDLVLVTRSHLERLLNEIQSTICMRCPRPEIIPGTQCNDQDVEEFKEFRLKGLYNRISSLYSRVILVSCHGIELIQKMQLTTKNDPYETDVVYFSQSNNVAQARQSILDNTRAVRKGIRCAIGWSLASDYDLVRTGWYEETPLIDGYSESVSRSIAHWKEGSGRPVPELYRAQKIKLYELLLPINKLCRLFFKKLSRRGIKEKRLPMFSKMRSDQLDSLWRFAAVMRYELMCLQEATNIPDWPGNTAYALGFNRVAKRLEDCFEPALHLILEYLVPLVPDTEGFPIQHYFRSWFTMWHTQFSIAIQNLIDHVELSINNAL